MLGISATQGPHQVAQKSTSSTLPVSFAWSNLVPSSRSPLISIGLPGSPRSRSLPAKPSASCWMRGFVLEAMIGPKVSIALTAAGLPPGICSRAPASCIANPAVWRSSGSAFKSTAVRSTTAAAPPNSPAENICWASATICIRLASIATDFTGLSASRAAKAAISVAAASSPSRPSAERLSSLSRAALA